MHFSPEAVQAAGLCFVGHSPPEYHRAGATMKSHHFRRNFGVGEAAIAALFNDLSKVTKFDPLQIYQTIYWLKFYPTLEQLRPLYQKCEKNISKGLKEGIQIILKVYDRNVYFSDFNQKLTISYCN